MRRRRQMARRFIGICLINVLRYGGSFIIGLILYHFAKIAAFNQRGYEAIGGEMFVIPLTMAVVLGITRLMMGEYDEEA